MILDDLSKTISDCSVNDSWDSQSHPQLFVSSVWWFGLIDQKYVMYNVLQGNHFAEGAFKPTIIYTNDHKRVKVCVFVLMLP